MANVQATITPLESLNGHTHRLSWALANTDIGTGAGGNNVGMSGAADRSVQVFGTFGAGGTVVIEGSNDGGVTWATLHDPQGNALSFTAVAFRTIDEVSEMIRPRVSAGDGTTALTVAMVFRRLL